MIPHLHLEEKKLEKGKEKKKTSLSHFIIARNDAWSWLQVWMGSKSRLINLMVKNDVTIN